MAAYLCSIKWPDFNSSMSAEQVVQAQIRLAENVCCGMSHAFGASNVKFVPPSKDEQESMVLQIMQSRGVTSSAQGGGGSSSSYS